jgi:type II secretory pathway component HofQ
MRTPILLLALSLILPVSAIAAQAPADDERRLSLELRQTPLRQAVAALFSGSTGQYVVDPDVPDVPVTLDVREVTVPAGLRLILRQAVTAAPGLTSSRDGEIYLIKMRSHRPGPITPTLPAGIRDRRVTFNLRQVPIRSALDVLFKASGMLPAVDARVPDVPITLALKDISLQQALRLVLRQAAIHAPGITGTSREERLYIGIVPTGVPQFAAEGM